MANVLQKSNTILFRILKLISENAKLQLANNVPECLMCGCIPRRRVGKNRRRLFLFFFFVFCLQVCAKNNQYPSVEYWLLFVWCSVLLC